MWKTLTNSRHTQWKEGKKNAGKVVQKEETKIKNKIVRTQDIHETNLKADADEIDQGDYCNDDKKMRKKQYMRIRNSCWLRSSVSVDYNGLILIQFHPEERQHSCFKLRKRNFVVFDWSISSDSGPSACWLFIGEATCFLADLNHVQSDPKEESLDHQSKRMRRLQRRSRWTECWAARWSGEWRVCLHRTS